MRKKGKFLGFVGLTMATIFFAFFFTFSIEANAAAKTKAIEGMSYNVNASLEENLKTLIGKRAHITTDSGTKFMGTVKAVGNHLLHLEKLDRKDFFDALIRIEDISAVDAKFRDFDR